MSELIHIKAQINGVECELVNMTPHSVTVFDVNGNQPIVTVPSSGMVRVSETVRTVSEGEGQVPLVQIIRDPYKIEGLPAWAIGRYVIVSDLAFQAAKTLGREDLLRPGPSVRDKSGRIIGCKGLAI